MSNHERAIRRVRVQRGVNRQPNGKYAVCVMVDGQPHFRTVEAQTVAGAQLERDLLRTLAARGELPVSPRLTFAEAAERWINDYEAKVATGQRRERTLDHYRSHIRRHLLPRLGRRRLGLITPDHVAAVVRERQAEGLSA